MKSAPQLPLPLERATWVGEAVAAVVAETRALAEDAAARVKVDYEPLPAVVDMETALDASQPPIHPELGDNLCFQRVNETGKVDDAFAAAHKVVEATFHTGRHTGVTLEPRSILADYNRASAKLTVYHATQAPHMMQGVFAKHMRLPEGDVRVICTDVGGSYGIKVHVYPDEMAVAVIAKIMGRPVKFIADRLESFSSDIHARDHRIKGAHGRRRRGPHHRHRHRRPDGHRPLLGLSAHQRGGGQPGREPGRRPLRLRQLPRQDHGGAAEQDADLPVPRRRPPDRHRRHRRARRPGRRGHGPRSRRVPPPQPDARRHLPAHLARRHEVRGPLPHRVARQAARHDRLPEPARRAGAAAGAAASTAASALRASSSSPTPAPSCTASAGRASRRRTAAPCASTPTAR